MAHKEAKQITITFSKWVYDQYLTGYEGNRSKLIEEMFVKGMENEQTPTKNYKIKILAYLKDVRDKNEEIRKLKAEIGRLKSNKGLSDEMIRAKARDRALKNANILEF